MADKESSKLDGIQFDLGKLKTLTQPLELAQQRTVGTTLTMPDTVAPLILNADSLVAGIGVTSENIVNFKGSYIRDAFEGAGSVATGAARLGVTNDAIAVVQHLVTGRLAAAAVEGAGVVGQGAGASAGVALVDLAISTSKVLPGTRVAGYVLAGSVGAYLGSNAAKDATVEIINSLDTTAPLAPGQTVQPIAKLNGATYGLGLTVEGKLDWYAISDNSNLALPSPIVSLPVDIRQQLTDQLAKATLPQEDFTKYTRMVGELKTLGDISENIVPRIERIGNVAIDESLNAPPAAAQVAQNLSNKFSPDGKEPLGVQISDGPGKSHSWRELPDGSVERIAQESYGAQGGKVTITTFGKGEVTPTHERQTVSGDGGIVSDMLLKPDATGAMTVDKIQLGRPLDASVIPTTNPFTPLPNSGDADNSYTIKPGDSLWKIGKTLAACRT